MQLEEYLCSFVSYQYRYCVLQTTYDSDMGLFVPVVPSAAPASMNHIANSACHGGQMLPPSPCQQSPDSSSSATGGVGRSHSAPQLANQRKRKGVIDWRSCSYVQTCQLPNAQANFRKSLRRGFLSPLAAQSSGEKHVSTHGARGGRPASSQVMPCTP